jgi:membrane protein
MTRPEDPTDLSKRSWTDTLKRTISEFRDDNLTDWAAALTYYALLSLFPALIALVSLVGLVADPATVTRVVTDTVTQLGPASAADTFSGPIQSITENSGRAGFLFVVGIATALWAASGYTGAFFRASNAIYEIEEGRPFWKLRPIQLLVTLVVIVLVALVALALVVSGPLAKAIGDAVGLGSTAVMVWNIAKWPVMALAVLVILAILYYAAPNAKLPGFKWISPGSVVALVVWIVASVGFAFYVANFGSYDKTYGTLGGVVTFLVWLWITNIAVLLGAEFNAELERSREIEQGVPGADRELRLQPRSEPKQKSETG